MDISELKDKSLEGIATYLRDTLDEVAEVTEDTMYGLVIMQENNSVTITQSYKNTVQLCLMVIAIMQDDAFSVKQATIVGDVLAEVIADA